MAIQTRLSLKGTPGRPYGAWVAKTPGATFTGAIVKAGEVYMAGASAGQVYVAGAVMGQVLTAGGRAGEVRA